MSALTYQADWRKTPIRYTPLGAGSDPFAMDAAVADVDRRKQFHAVLDRACSAKNIAQDRAERLHARLDRLLDEHPGFFREPEEELDEEPEEESESEPVDESEQVRKHEASATAKDSGRTSYAMDGNKCSECRIQDNHVPEKKTVALDAAQGGMARTVIGFWRQFGINLREV